ncbi:High affinity cAMP-specific and IBMX-insensitive 3',5'-cyclic phosphodiesterase 8B, partial [Blyttiomyces sp. JEL0837]
LDDSVLNTFLTTVEGLYKPNPYHNSTHAADVLHAVHYFISVLGLETMLKKEEIFAAIIAASIHDLDHPGVNNAYLINSSSPLAIRYNDLAVLENHHCAKAFETILGDPACNIFAKLSPDKFKQIRSCILSMVLATDMAGHFEHIAKFKNKLSGNGLDYEDAKDRQLLLDIAIKCGDISNAAKSNELCKKWASAIMDEFFLQ